MHFAIEIYENWGKCRKCGEQTLLIAPWSTWQLDSGDDEFDDEVEISEEVTAHYCKGCNLITGFWINT